MKENNPIISESKYSTSNRTNFMIQSMLDSNKSIGYISILLLSKLADFGVIDASGNNKSYNNINKPRHKSRSFISNHLRISKNSTKSMSNSVLGNSL